MVGFKRLTVFAQEDGLFFFFDNVVQAKIFFSEMTLKPDGHAGRMRSEKQEFSSLSKTEKIGSDQRQR
jgi:hypothetical protein